jgi:hypothetical protein
VVADQSSLEGTTNKEYFEILTNPQDMNSYSYVTNNPLKYIDVTGESTTSALWGWAVGVGQGVVSRVQQGLNFQAHPIQTAINTFLSTLDTAQKAAQIASDLKTDPKGTISKANDVANKSFDAFMSKSDYEKGKVVGRLTEGVLEVAAVGKVSAGEAVSSSSQDLFINPHTALRMRQRNISSLDISNTVQNGEKFDYFHDGALKTGYYDSASKIFVGTLKNEIKTVINNVKRNYINNLKNK